MTVASVYFYIEATVFTLSRDRGRIDYIIRIIQSSLGSEILTEIGDHAY